MVLEILVTVSHFAGKMKFFLCIEEEFVPQNGSTDYVFIYLAMSHKIIPVSVY